ncbi:unnamed protein product [Microthlaspi erraticum]|uniref:mitogen-activated protein kinase n=1 Tax=Microthlaspi erraticum TaxID=1685480 RepID=A0A6D2HX07_9BRAS|nr:unnamed protein product [Microthlaspi erraticum]
MKPDNDAEPEETHGEVTTDGKFERYNVLGQIFEVTAKYKPPTDPIGRGGYGFVCSVTNSETNERVAVKKIVNAFVNQTNAKRALREIKILRHLKHHDNIVKIKDVIVPRQRNAFREVYIGCELMEYDLLKVIKSNEVLTPAHHQYLLYQILRGLKYMHSADVLHRDLKPSNLLVGVEWNLKICDFGLARAISEGGVTSAQVGAGWYRAPELLLNSSGYTKAVDVWSVGCIFFELINRKPFFRGQDAGHQLRLLMELIGSPSEEYIGSLNENTKRYIRQFPWFPRQSFSEKFPNVPPLAIDLMKKFLTFDPRQRISVEEALAHPYLQSLHDITNEPECTTPFKFDIGQQSLTKKEARELIYREALDFNPEFQQE